MLQKSFFSRLSTFGIVSILLIFAVVAVSLVWVYSSTETITIGRAVTVTNPMPTTLNAFAGDFYSYNIDVKNEANQPHNYTYEYWITSDMSLVTGDVNLKLIDRTTNATLAQSNVIVANEVRLIITDKLLDSAITNNLNATVEFATGAQNGTYNLSFGVKPGTDSFN